VVVVARKEDLAVVIVEEDLEVEIDESEAVVGLGVVRFLLTDPKQNPRNPQSITVVCFGMVFNGTPNRKL